MEEQYNISGRNNQNIKNLITINKILVVVNAIVFIVTSMRGDTTDAYYLYECGGVTPYDIFIEKEFTRLFTSMFIHSGISHIINNMLMLWLMGELLEKEIGKIRYSVLYFVSGIIAGVFSQFYHRMQGQYYIVSVGASGAIFGVIGAVVWILIRNKGNWKNISLRRILIYLIISIVAGLFDSGIGLMAHIGGFVAGFVICMILYRKRGVTYEN